jgi:hypothetical protein
MYDATSPYGETPPSMSDMEKILGRSLTKNQYNFAKGQFSSTKNARTHKLVQQAVDALPLSIPMRQKIIEMVEPEIARKRRDGLTGNQAVVYLVAKTVAQVSTITSIEEIQKYIAKAGFRFLKVKRVSFKVMTDDPAKLKILTNGRPYKGKKKLVRMHGNIYELKLKPSLADVDSNDELDIELVGGIIATPAKEFEPCIGRIVSNNRAKLKINPKRCFDTFKTEKRVASTFDDPNRGAERNMRMQNVMRKYNPSSNNYPLSKCLYEKSGYTISLLREYKALFEEKMAREHGKLPETVAKEALREADAKVFGLMERGNKMEAIEFFRLNLAGSKAVDKRDERYVGVKGLLVPSEFGGL